MTTEVKGELERLRELQNKLVKEGDLSDSERAELESLSRRVGRT